jgi:type VI secretion system protein ImpF
MHAFRVAHEARDARKRVDLRDESGDRVLAGRRAAARTIITESVLRREVSRDLETLMNTINMASSEDLTEFEAVRSSILNFGVPDITHRSIQEITVDDISRELELALTTYEPRLLRDSIEVRRDHNVGDDDLKVRFFIRADLFCDPINVPVEFVADLQVDSGAISISRA